MLAHQKGPDDTLGNGLGCDSAPCLGWANLTLGEAKLLVWGSEMGRSALSQVPCSECTSDLVLQMSKASGWVTTWTLQV